MASVNKMYMNVCKLQQDMNGKALKDCDDQLVQNMREGIEYDDPKVDQKIGSFLSQ